MNPKQYGLIINPITPDHWVLGAANSGAPGEVINPSGDWTPYLPDKEPQSKNGIETQNCSGFGTDNAVETLSAFKGIKANYSDRYLGIMAGTDPHRGNDPHIVAETLRKASGQIDESLLPFSDDITTPEAYYQPKPIPQYLVDKGNLWYNQWDFAHEWVFTGGTPQDKKTKLKDALTKGTVCVSVYAWQFNQDKNWFEKPTGVTDNHWCQIAKINANGTYLIFDSYDGYLKTLAPDFDFSVAKIFYLTPAAPKIAWAAKLLNLIGQLLHLDALLIQKSPIVVNPPKQLPVIPPIMPAPLQSRIPSWAKAIQVQEGWTPGSRSYKNNNPGNLRYTPYTHSLGAIGHDADNFCIFPNADHGLSALMQFLTDACHDQLTPYHSTMTLVAFTQVYANPPSGNYAHGVADALKVAVNTPIKQLL